MDKWKINLNKQKTQALNITNGYSRQLPGNHIMFLNEKIKWESEAKYLGLVIDKRLTLRQHVDYVSDRAHTAFCGCCILYLAETISLTSRTNFSFTS